MLRLLFRSVVFGYSSNTCTAQPGQGMSMYMLELPSLILLTSSSHPWVPTIQKER